MILKIDEDEYLIGKDVTWKRWFGQAPCRTWRSTCAGKPSLSLLEGEKVKPQPQPCAVLKQLLS